MLVAQPLQHVLDVLARLSVQHGLTADIAFGESGPCVVRHKRQLEPTEFLEQLGKIAHASFDVLLRHERVNL